METQKPPRTGNFWLRCQILFHLLIVLLAIDGLIHSQRKTWRAYDPDEYCIRPRHCRHGTWDLILVGGSPVCEGIDPARLTGTTWRGHTLERVYNLGLSGGTTSEVWHAVSHGIAQPPQLLIYGITASDLNDSRDEPHGPATLMRPGDLVCWARYRPAATEWCLRQFVQAHMSRLWQLYAYRNGIRLWAADRIDRFWPNACPAAAAEARSGLHFSNALRSGSGFAPRQCFVASRLDHLKAARALPPFHFLDKYRLGGHVHYLHRLLDWGDDLGVPVVLVDMPVSADLEEAQFAAEFARYRELLAELSRTRNVCLLRASRSNVGLTEADFADQIHLNAQGARRLSDWLRAELTKMSADPMARPSATKP
jgi:hypothetical protein